LAGHGQLGYGNTNTIGDDETPASAGDVDVGETVTQISAGAAHTCALLASGNIRCWGQGSDGRLGYGNQSDIGDDETPVSAGNVPVQ
jgi:alpha-tubulin suppressor-like RCC1 family protein